MTVANPLVPSLSINATVMKYIGFRSPTIVRLVYTKNRKNRYNFRINIISDAFRARRVKRSVSLAPLRAPESTILKVRQRSYTLGPFRRRFTLTIYAIDFVSGTFLHGLSSVRPCRSCTRMTFGIPYANFPKNVF